MIEKCYDCKESAALIDIVKFIGANKMLPFSSSLESLHRKEFLKKIRIDSTWETSSNFVFSVKQNRLYLDCSSTNCDTSNLFFHIFSWEMNRVKRVHSQILTIHTRKSSYYYYIHNISIITLDMKYFFWQKKYQIKIHWYTLDLPVLEKNSFMDSTRIKGRGVLYYHSAK